MSNQKFVTEARQKRVSDLVTKFQEMVIRDGGAQWEEYAAALGMTAKLLAISAADATNTSRVEWIKSVRVHLDAGFATPVDVKFQDR